MSKASQNVLRGIRQDPAAVALAKEVEALEAQETMRLDAIRDAADVRVMRQKLAEAERKLAALRIIANEYALKAEVQYWGVSEAMRGILDGKGE